MKKGRRKLSAGFARLSFAGRFRCRAIALHFFFFAWSASFNDSTVLLFPAARSFPRQRSRRADPAVHFIDFQYVLRIKVLSP
jgi:hypothetical protein